MDIEVTWPRCECGHSAYDHEDDGCCTMAFLDSCFGYWPDGLRVSRGDMITRWKENA